jgi:hypothetical protein
LPPILGRPKRSLHPDLPLTWPHPVRLGTPPDLQIALCAALPFEHAAAVIEGLSAWGEDIKLHIYGWPWVQGQHWPAAIPSLMVHAIHDLGQEHDSQAGNWRSYGAGEAVHYRMSPGNVPCVAGVRPDACALADNHVLDFGRRGLQDTLDAVSDAGWRPGGDLLLRSFLAPPWSGRGVRRQAGLVRLRGQHQRLGGHYRP